jgi:hypothetical protein
MTAGSAAVGGRPEHDGLACQAEPDRWLAAEQRSATLRQCLRCPVRSWCAQQALAVDRPRGMWAGVWIDGPRSESAEAHLREIAGTPLPADPAAAVHLRIVTDEPSPVANAARRRRPLEPLPLSNADGVLSDPQVTGLVAARSNGHCEVMTADCTLGYGQLVSRTRGAVRTAADLFAVCASCLTTLGTLGDDVCGHFGYRVDGPDALFGAPFLWRQTHWVLLHADGAMTATKSPKATGVTRRWIC